MTQIIKVRNIHLAAYIKANGGVVKGYKDGKFIFESDKTFDDWNILHSNSCCRKVDQELINLKIFVKGNKL